jgi:hypothetical protein
MDREIDYKLDKRLSEPVNIFSVTTNFLYIPKHHNKPRFPVWEILSCTISTILY